MSSRRSNQLSYTPARVFRHRSKLDRIPRIKKKFEAAVWTGKVIEWRLQEYGRLTVQSIL